LRGRKEVKERMSGHRGKVIGEEEFWVEREDEGKEEDDSGGR